MPFFEENTVILSAHTTHRHSWLSELKRCQVRLTAAQPEGYPFLLHQTSILDRTHRLVAQKVGNQRGQAHLRILVSDLGRHSASNFFHRGRQRGSHHQ